MVRHARQMVADGDARHIARRAGRIPPGLADREDRSHRPEAGGCGARTPSNPALGGLDRRCRHACLRHRLLRQRPAASIHLPPISPPSCRAASSTTTPTSCCASDGGAAGMLWTSQVSPGNENNLKLRVYGTKGGLEWHQEHPNQLLWSPFGKPTQILSRGHRRRQCRRGPRDARAAGTSRGLS